MSSPNMMFELDFARRVEARRRKQVLGDLVNKPYSFGRFQQHSWKTQVPVEVLKGWYGAYQLGGEDALLPDWAELPEDVQQYVQKLYEGLAPFVEQDSISPDDIANYATSRNMSYRSAQRWIQRYCIGGFWGLAPKYNPLRIRRRSDNKRAPRNTTTATDAQLEEVLRRFGLIEPLVQKANLTERDVVQRAEETGISRSTLWDYLSSYRKYGPSGLIPKTRSDAGTTRLSPLIENLVKSIRLTHKDWSP